MRKLLNNFTLKRILLIFFVGLISRIIVNYVYDINVFKEYSDTVSLIYYGFMAGFTGFVYEWPNISLHAFNFNLVKSAIKMFEGKFMVGDKILTGDPSDITKLDKKLLEDSLVSKMNTPNPQNDGNSNGGQGPNNNGPAGVPGNTSALIQGAPDIKPNGKYDTPPMVYVPGGNNQPYGRILSKALENEAIRTHHTDTKGNASTMAYNPTKLEDDAKRFISDFFADKFPNRSVNNLWNSDPVRKELRNL